MTILQTEDLWRIFGGVAAVGGVNFTLEKGELRCLIGANGAGKSTFFKMLTGQLRPSKGRILLKGEDVCGLDPHQIARRGVGIKTQVPNLFDGLDVRENLRLAAMRVLPTSEAHVAAEAMLEEIRLGDVAKKDVGELPHGQRQWVELGMVLVHKPDLVLLDEPTAGMTRGEVERTIALIDRLRNNCTLVVVEHDMHFIRRIAERVTVLHRGRILVEDTMDAVVQNQEVRAAYLGRKAGGLDVD